MAKAWHADAGSAGDLRTTYEEPDNLWLRVHFTSSEPSQAAGHEFLKRFRLRREACDPEVSDRVAPAQLAAAEKWGAPRGNPYEYPAL